MFSWLTSNATGIGVLVAAVTFVWSAIQFIVVRRKEQKAHEFEAFHRLIKELVSPDAGTQSTWVDRQMAAVFELRHFPRYYEVTLRILTGLREQWGKLPEPKSRLLDEIDLTLQYITKRKPNKSLSGGSVFRN